MKPSEVLHRAIEASVPNATPDEVRKAVEAVGASASEEVIHLRREVAALTTIVERLSDRVTAVESRQPPTA